MGNQNNINRPEEDIIISPSKMGYKDRKMAKWQGFILAEQADMLQKMEEKRKPAAIREEQDAQTITERLQHSYVKRSSVTIQLNIKEGDSYSPDISGVVVGFDQGKVYVQSNEGSIEAATEEDIRHVSPYQTVKWFDI